MTSSPPSRGRSAVLATVAALLLGVALAAPATPAAAQTADDPSGEVASGSEPVPTTPNPTPNDPIVCSLAASRTRRALATNPDYSLLRAALLNPANFGHGGIVPETVTFRPGVAVIDAAAVTGCDVFWASEVFSIAPAEVSTLVSAVLNGMTLISDADSAGSFVAPQNAILNALDGSSSSAASVCASGMFAGAISSADNPATNGPFGDVRNLTFATSPASLVSPAADDHTVIRCGTSILRMVIPPGKLGPGSGLVMAGGDPSALNLFLGGSNPNNRILYLNAFAASVSADQAPAVTIESQSPGGDEGAPIALDATVTGDGSPTTQWSYAPGVGVDAGATCSFAQPAAVDTTITCTDDGTYTVTLTADDGVNPPVAASADVSVANVAPTVHDLAISGGTSACLTGITVDASFASSDPGSNDALAGAMDWGDGSAPDAGFSGSHTYAAGSYTLTGSASDDDGGSDSATAAISLLFETSGILPPINADGSSNFKLGRVVPVKLGITDCIGADVTDLSPRVSLRRIGPGAGEVNEVVSASTADEGNTMRYSGSGSHYTYNLSTRLSQFNEGRDLEPGRYELTITEQGITPVVVEFDLRP